MSSVRTWPRTVYINMEQLGAVVTKSLGYSIFMKSFNVYPRTPNVAHGREVSWFRNDE